ncbi:MAG: SMC-Scp complex subunit ScpB [Elusimicrobiaceae bacterium]|nr:SMC-Scp complex subunit ScpB [Elusimicrobiaceae bacterium]
MENTPQTEELNKEEVKQEQTSAEQNQETNNEEKKQEEVILSRSDFKNIIETLLFITDKPLSASKVNQVAEIGDLALTRDIIQEIQTDYANAGSAVQVLEIGGGFQMCTKPEYGRWVRKLYNEKMSIRLSPAALETLAIIAYKQPVTRAEIEVIRGVDVSGPLEKLLDRGLVKIAGKKEVAGRPLVYATTDQFLRVFGLNHLSELPDMKTFAAKGPKEIQSDLPFDQAMPPFKDNILPLEENNISAEDDTSTEGDTDIQTNNVQNEGLLDQENNQEQNEKGGTK